MSQIDLQSISDSIDALTASYTEAARLLHKIQAHRKAAPPLHGGPGVDRAAQELEQSLKHGRDHVRAQYDRNERRFPGLFAKGDRESPVCFTAPHCLAC